jgi:hypothetical protein
MNNNSLWSLRLGFGNKQKAIIEKLGLEQFLKNLFQTKVDTILPSFFKDEPKTIEELKAMRQEIKHSLNLGSGKAQNKNLNALFLKKIDKTNSFLLYLRPLKMSNVEKCNSKRSFFSSFRCN